MQRTVNVDAAIRSHDELVNHVVVVVAQMNLDDARELELRIIRACTTHTRNSERGNEQREREQQRRDRQIERQREQQRGVKADRK